MSAPATIVEFPMLLVLDEKHEPLHFLVRSDMDLFAVALTIVRLRAAHRWYDEETVRKAEAIKDGREASVAQSPRVRARLPSEVRRGVSMSRREELQASVEGFGARRVGQDAMTTTGSQMRQEARRAAQEAQASLPEVERIEDESDGECPCGCGEPAFPYFTKGLPENGYFEAAQGCARAIAVDALLEAGIVWKGGV